VLGILNIIGLLIIINLCIRGQDPQFTQFYSVPLYLGPSFAGATQQHRISACYRSQWLGIPGNYNTYTVAYDRYYTPYNSGMGILFMRDEAGSGKLGYIYFSVLYSYDFNIFQTWHVRPGLSFIYNVYSLDFSKLFFSDQINSDGIMAAKGLAVPPTNDMRGNIDGSVSGLIYNDKIWFGSTIDHLLRPNMSFYGDKSNIPLKYTFYGGIKLVSKGRLLKPVDESISIAYLYRILGDYRQFDLGLYWLNPPLVLGIWYRGIPMINSQRGDAVAFLAGVKMYKLSFAYSYDFTVSNLINSTRGAHELSLIFEFRTEKKKKFHAIPCPEF